MHRWTPRTPDRSRDGSFEERPETADNPYLGLLGAADAIIVTANSASMCTEACATGKPVFLFRPAAGVSTRLARLQAALEGEGHLHPLGSAWPERRPPPLNPAMAVADAIRARLALPISAAAGQAVAPRPSSS